MTKHILSAPKYTVIEKTAAELAGVFYDACRSSGMKSEYKSAKTFARAKFTTFIPKAVELLISMLGRSDIHDLMKQEIHGALMERHNDPELNAIMPNQTKLDIEKYLPKSDPPPIIINTPNYKVTVH